MIKTIVLLTLAATSAVAQSCTQSRVLDDFKVSNYSAGLNRYYNLAGGDYGGEGVSLSLDNVNPNGNGYISATVTNTTGNFFFFKTNFDACEDISGYYGVYFDFEGPAGGNSTFTLTQMQSDCVTRNETGDSTYVNVQDYLPNKAITGARQTVIIPFTDVRFRADGVTPYDFIHFKDFTFVTMLPLDSVWKFYNFTLLGTCNPPPVTTTSTSTSSPASTAGSGAQGSSAAAPLITSLFGLIAALFV